MYHFSLHTTLIAYTSVIIFSLLLLVDSHLSHTEVTFGKNKFRSVKAFG